MTKTSKTVQTALWKSSTSLLSTFCHCTRAGQSTSSPTAVHCSAFPRSLPWAGGSSGFLHISPTKFPKAQSCMIVDSSIDRTENKTKGKILHLLKTHPTYQKKSTTEGEKLKPQHCTSLCIFLNNYNKIKKMWQVKTPKSEWKDNKLKEMKQGLSEPGKNMKEFLQNKIRYRGIMHVEQLALLAMSQHTWFCV